MVICNQHLIDLETHAQVATLEPENTQCRSYKLFGRCDIQQEQKVGGGQKKCISKKIALDPRANRAWLSN